MGLPGQQAAAAMAGALNNAGAGLAANNATAGANTGLVPAAVGGFGRLSNALNLAQGVAAQQNLVVFSSAREAANSNIYNNYLRNPNVPDRFVEWRNQNFTTEVFEAQYNTSGSWARTVHGPPQVWCGLVCGVV